MSAVTVRWVRSDGWELEACTEIWPCMLDDLSCWEAMGDKEIAITLDTGEKWEWRRHEWDGLEETDD